MLSSVARADWWISEGRTAFNNAHPIAAQTRSPFEFGNCRLAIEFIAQRSAAAALFARSSRWDPSAQSRVASSIGGDRRLGSDDGSNDFKMRSFCMALEAHAFG